MRLFGPLWTCVQMSQRAVELHCIPGEYVLNASKGEYKVDAVIFDGYHGLELCLEETSGLYKLQDVPRFGYDHIKGCFGALTLLNAIIKKYRIQTCLN